jgi:hypothetical protein
MCETAACTAPQVLTAYRDVRKFPADGKPSPK